MIDIALVLAGGMLSIAALLLLYRVVVGPSLVDRVIASDVMLTTLIIVVGTEMAINGHTRTIPLMVVLAVVGIFGSVSVARFVTRPTAASEDAEAAASSHASLADAPTTNTPTTGTPTTDTPTTEGGPR